MKILIDIQYMMELPLAFSKAIEQYKENKDAGSDVFNGQIILVQINFESNYKHTNYECVFEITEGDK